MRNLVGWSYPPGAANDPNAPWNQADEGPCDVCGKPLDDCICPECPHCQANGDPQCYVPGTCGGLILSAAQAESLAAENQFWERADEATKDADADAREQANYGRNWEY